MPVSHVLVRWKPRHNSEGREMLMQVWHQIFDKVNWCLFIFGIFTGKQNPSFSAEQPLFLLCHSYPATVASAAMPYSLHAFLSIVLEDSGA